MTALEPEAEATEERRVAPRTRTLKRAKVIFNNGYSTFDCIVRNISATGALLTIDEAAHLPKEFQVRIGEDKTERLAKLVYRRGVFAGIRFLDVEVEDYGPVGGLVSPGAMVPSAGPEDRAGTLATIRRIEPERLPEALLALLPWR